MRSVYFLLLISTISFVMSVMVSIKLYKELNVNKTNNCAGFDSISKCLGNSFEQVGSK